MILFTECFFNAALAWVKSQGWPDPPNAISLSISNLNEEFISLFLLFFFFDY